VSISVSPIKTLSTLLRPGRRAWLYRAPGRAVGAVNPTRAAWGKMVRLVNPARWAGDGCCRSPALAPQIVEAIAAGTAAGGADRASPDPHPRPADRLDGADAAARHRLSPSPSTETEPAHPGIETEAPVLGPEARRARSPVRNRRHDARETPGLPGARPENAATPGLTGWANWIRTVVMLLI
jgi:hypothetical protein